MDDGSLIPFSTCDITAGDSMPWLYGQLGRNPTLLGFNISKNRNNFESLEDLSATFHTGVTHSAYTVLELNTNIDDLCHPEITAPTTAAPTVTTTAVLVILGGSNGTARLDNAQILTNNETCINSIVPTLDMGGIRGSALAGIQNDNYLLYAGGIDNSGFITSKLI